MIELNDMNLNQNLKKRNDNDITDPDNDNNYNLNVINSAHNESKQNKSYWKLINEFKHDIKARDNIDERLKLKCVMNQNIFSQEDFTYKVKQCFSCPGKLENICEFCYDNCHQDHNNHLKGVSITDKIVSISKVSCDFLRFRKISKI